MTAAATMPTRPVWSWELIHQDLTDYLAANKAPHHLEPMPGAKRALTARELQVINLVAAGCSNAEIARMLGLSPLTVKSHLARMGDALSTGSRARMVAITLDAPAPSAPPADNLGLTDRQIDVLALVGLGLTNPEIGRRLHITEDTVKTHQRKTMAKLGARSRGHAVALAIRAGLLTRRSRNQAGAS